MTLPPSAPASLPALGPLPLSHGSVDRGCERRTDPEWLPGLMADPATRVLALAAGKAPVAGGSLVLHSPAGLPEPRTVVYLGASEGQEFVAAGWDEVPDVLAGTGDWLGLREVAAGLPVRDASLFVEALAILNWHATHGHCPRCGAPTEPVQSGWVRTCTADGTLHFPRTDPAIIVAVTDGADRLLLGANAQWGGKHYSTLAGFVEPGESLEAAVAREVAEESGIAVTGAQYAGSQPWPFPCSLMLGFTARASGTDAVPDGEEIVDLRWFTRAELAAEVEEGRLSVPVGLSIASALIEQWYGGPLPAPRGLGN
ncbi:NTP pyrophosphohydrolase [Zafaria cholistanensis]|uniref:NAD(+) diphosphatase n=1 Tax=Zafaria cholistanensis TaxID=1682741 RepID=A0A5A7NNV0_9MICC|nr:NAD(+) diphosphatase [Zafaria cholistanensis]GER21842.1 NTP pyrophosphohydrolase [Zafaria cholistanensis]